MHLTNELTNVIGGYVCPPGDCSGPDAFRELNKAWMDCRHPEYKSTIV